MKFWVNKAQADRIGRKLLAGIFGEDQHGRRWEYSDAVGFTLRGLSTKKLDQLDALLKAAAADGGDNRRAPIGTLQRDLAAWRAALDGGARALKARTIEQFKDLAIEFLRPAPRHWVFHQDKNQPGLVPFYVSAVKFHPPNDRTDSPAHVTISLAAEDLGGTVNRMLTVWAADMRGKTVAEVLADKGVVIPDDAMLAEHDADIARWDDLHRKVGLQCMADGAGTNDVDGNDDDDDHDRRWWWRDTKDYRLEVDGVKSRVVVDVFHESDRQRNRRSDGGVQLHFWSEEGRRENDEDGDDDEPGSTGREDLDSSDSLPIHPNLVVFDFRRHLRLKVHCRQLTEYQYDDEAGGKLVLDADRKALVRLLIEMKAGGFYDIVAGKGGGAVVLLAGPPGTGKTLTAEVYAEAEQRPLYSVQCSQLGTDPEELEDALLKVFARGKRWNAVMLLDEADVYVHERGNDMNQNAIVGVFLRLLEYQDTVLFLTTNRPDDVDDAVASRCIARLTYTAPSASDQARLWRVLADVSGTDLPDGVIGDLVADNPGLSGRDVKNLLKLARLMPGAISRDTIRFVRQFQPTRQRPARPGTESAGKG